MFVFEINSDCFCTGHPAKNYRRDVYKLLPKIFKNILLTLEKNHDNHYVIVIF